MSDPHIVEQRADGVLTLSIRRPDKKNSLTVSMYHALQDALRRADADMEVGAVLLAGTADCFTAGNDLHDFFAATQSAEPQDGGAGLDFIEALSQCDTPVVAAVNGIAIGIGTTLLLHCDFVHAGRSAQFRTPFVDLGLCPEAASSLLLPLMAGPRRAAEMLLAGEPLNAEAALACGLINRIHDDADTERAAHEQALQLARKPRESMRLTKRLMRRHHAEAVAETMAYERRKFGERLKSDDCKAALQNFFGRGKA